MKKIIQGDWEYILVLKSSCGYSKYKNIKTGEFFKGKKSFIYYPCEKCGKLISTSGLAINHKCKELKK